MNGIEAARKLAHLGYRFTVKGETIKASFQGPGEPDPAQVRPLLEAVKEHKAEVVSYLAQTPEITCHECSRFRPAVISPNSAQAWGHCQERNRGRYGVAAACGAVEAKS